MEKMGELIIITGPSGVGKGPMVETLKIYLDSIHESMKKHVLYTTREKKQGEVYGETYWYSYLMKVNTSTYDESYAESELERIKNERNINDNFQIFTLPTQQQGIDFSELQKDLKDNKVVLLEIFQGKVEDVIKFCNRNIITVKRIFISPLLDDDYKKLDCTTNKSRAILTELTMLRKLIERGRDSIDDILKRAKKAIIEVDNARELRDKREPYFNYLVNHIGEDEKEKWEKLQKRVSEYPQDYDYRNNTFLYTEEIDNTFRQFLEYIFS